MFLTDMSPTLPSSWNPNSGRDVCRRVTSRYWEVIYGTERQSFRWKIFQIRSPAKGRRLQGLKSQWVLPIPLWQTFFFTLESLQLWGTTHLNPESHEYLLPVIKTAKASSHLPNGPLRKLTGCWMSWARFYSNIIFRVFSPLLPPFFSLFHSLQNPHCRQFLICFLPFFCF